MLEKIEREDGLIIRISSLIPDHRNQSFVVHSYEKMLKQRVFLLMQGYEDANDAEYLKYDPILQTILGGSIVSQSTILRFENHINKHTIYNILNTWIDESYSLIVEKFSKTMKEKLRSL